ncbi:chitinase [Calycina marina]|uniref:chitinase n=1 Tax=Calycina marina TaxID=1763456 RepID=A0A9P7Z7R2_9HELO|nr:chitinase [Calycina marina]
MINAIYYPNWREETPASLDYRYISHVFYAFAHVGEDGNVFLNDLHADTSKEVDGQTNGCIGSLMRMKAQHGVKVILSVGGAAASQNFAKVAHDANLRNNFGASAKRIVDKYGFDGIDIDWEHPSNAEEGQDFLHLLKVLRNYLSKANGYTLSAALPAGQWVLRNIDLRNADDLDFLNLMAYDFAGPWSNLSGHHAQLYSAQPQEESGNKAVKYVISTGFPAEKIVLGIPAYGRSFLGVTGPGSRPHGHGGNEGAFDYKDLPRGNSEHVDSNLVAAYCTGEDGFISYDNASTVETKAVYCRCMKLGGIFYWTGTGDVSDASLGRSLVHKSFLFLDATTPLPLN